MVPLAPGAKELKRIGDQIRKARLDQDVSLRKFAAELNLSPSYFSKVERGEALAGGETYELICSKLGLDAKTVLARIGLVDSETKRLFEQQYRVNAQEVQGMLRKMAEKKPK